MPPQERSCTPKDCSKGCLDVTKWHCPTTQIVRCQCSESAKRPKDGKGLLPSNPGPFLLRPLKWSRCKSRREQTGTTIPIFVLVSTKSGYEWVDYLVVWLNMTEYSMHRMCRIFLCHASSRASPARQPCSLFFSKPINILTPPCLPQADTRPCLVLLGKGQCSPVLPLTPIGRNQRKPSYETWRLQDSRELEALTGTLLGANHHPPCSWWTLRVYFATCVCVKTAEPGNRNHVAYFSMLGLHFGKSPIFEPHPTSFAHCVFFHCLSPLETTTIFPLVIDSL